MQGRWGAGLVMLAGLAVCPPMLAAQVPLAPDAPLAKGVARSVAESAAVVLARQYVDSAAGEAYAVLLRRGAANGRYDSLATSHRLGALLTADLNALRRDGHLGVYPMGDPPGDAARPDSATRAERRRRGNGGFTKVERLPGNIGYLRFDGFVSPDVAAPAADAAFTFLQGTDALILDLRENMGGSPAMVAYLVTRLLPPGRVELLNQVWVRGDSVPRQYWTVNGLAGPRYLRPVYVLMAAKTLSAPEELAYDLRVLKRATIVGERSGGGANPGGMVPLGHGFGIFVSRAMAIHPVTGTNWEGVGVAPDVAVAASDALATAHRLALEAVLAGATDPEHAAEVREALSALTARTP